MEVYTPSSQKFIAGKYLHKESEITVIPSHMNKMGHKLEMQIFKSKLYLTGYLAKHKNR